MKKYAIFLFTVGFLVAHFANAQNTNNARTLHLKATGKVEVAPDKATFSINLECLEQSPIGSKNCLSEKSHKLHKGLREMGIEKEDIKTTSVNMYKSYKYEKGTRIFEGYKSSTTIIVTIRNLDILDEVYGKLLKNKDLTLNGLSYSHSDMETLKIKAHVLALRNANALADALLKELDVQHKEVITIGNVSYKTSVPRPLQKTVETLMVADRNGSDSDQTIAISKGLITVYASLQVEYLIK